jgi:hypothetical protein
MTIRIENASKSLAYVSVENAVGDEPTSEKDGVKTYAVGLRIIATTVPQHASDRDLIGSTALGPGETLPVDTDAPNVQFGFVAVDPDLGHFGVEQVEEADGVTCYRLHEARSGTPPAATIH